MNEEAAAFAVRDNAEKHRFEVDLGDSVAFADYTPMRGKIMFTHTEVPKAHEGKGIATAIVRAALASARERGLKVVPTCPFFASYIRKHVEEQDLLEPYYRKVLGLD